MVYTSTLFSFTKRVVFNHKVFLFALFLFSVFLTPLLLSQPAHAKDMVVSDSSKTMRAVQSIILQRSLALCIGNEQLAGGAFADRITDNGAKDWFAGSWTSTKDIHIATGPFMRTVNTDYSRDEKSGYGFLTQCGKGSDTDIIVDDFVKIYLGAQGAGAKLDVLCKSDFVREKDNQCPGGNESVSGRLKYKTGSTESANAFKKNFPEKKADAESWYWLYRKTFNHSCGTGKIRGGAGVVKETDATYKAEKNKGDDGIAYRLFYVTDQKKDTAAGTNSPYSRWEFIIGNADYKRKRQIPVFPDNSQPNSVFIASCARIEEKIQEWGEKYAAQLANKSPEEVEEKSEEDRKEVVEESGTDENPTSCDIQGTGWIICPIANTMATFTDVLYGWITNFLMVQPLNMDTAANDNTMYIAWKTMRNIANIAFVAAFLIIIFSQLTGSGINNYGVKKLLPRLVVAAILVNISYWIAAIAVDISNIIGTNTYNLLRNMGVGSVQFDANIFEDMFVWLLSAGAIGGTAAGITLLSANIAAWGPVLLWGGLVVLLIAALALLVAFVVLALRQAIIIILIVLSPLAFVAFLLPNTERFFNMWRKSLTTLLVFFPLFSLLFGGSYIAGMIIIGSSTNTSLDGSQLDQAAVGLLPLMGLAVMTAPLALTPLLIKFSTGIMGQVAGMVNNKSKGLIDRSRKVRNRKAGLAFNEGMNSPKLQNSRFRRFASGAGLYRRVQNSGRVDASRQRAIDGANTSAYTEAILDPESGLANRASGVSSDSLVKAAALAAASKEENEEIAAEKLLLTRDNQDLSVVLKNEKESTVRRAAAAGLIAERGTDMAIHDALNHVGTGKVGDEKASKAIQQQFAASLGSRKPTSLGAGDMSSLKTGNYTGTTSEKAADRFAKGKISADSLANTSADELALMKDSIRAAAVSGDQTARENIDKLRKSIDERFDNKNIAQPSEEVARAMRALQSAAGEGLGSSSASGQSQNLPPESMI